MKSKKLVISAGILLLTQIVFAAEREVIYLKTPRGFRYVERINRCLVQDRILLSESTKGFTSCKAVRAPVLTQAMLTYPKLGTRSYAVSYWTDGLATRSYQFITETLVEITNVCLDQLVSSKKIVDTEVISEELVFEPLNPNLDEKIDNEAALQPSSKASVMAQFQKFVKSCGL